MSLIPNFKENLPDCLLTWVAHSVSPQATVVEVSPLAGSTSSTLHSLTLAVEGNYRKVVLRQYDNLEWRQEEPDLARHEAAALELAARTGLPVPQMLAVEPTGEVCGVPLLLMSQLEGRVILRPTDLTGWLSGLAETLARIHALDASRFPWDYFPYIDLPKLEVPEWSGYRAEWQFLVDFVRQGLPPTPTCFIHRDYHPANVLWQDGKVSGVVDWPSACQGPAGVDLGHCRVELAQLYDVPTADTFLTVYERLAPPHFRYDPYWDVLSLFDILFGPPEVYPGWPVFGVTDLTAALVRQRLESYMFSLLARVKRV